MTATTMMTEQRTTEPIPTLDDAWNTQDSVTFEARHKPDVVVQWPGKPPTHGLRDHRAESEELFTTFTANRILG